MITHPRLALLAAAMLLTAWAIAPQGAKAQMTQQQIDDNARRLQQNDPNEERLRMNDNARRMQQNDPSGSPAGQSPAPGQGAEMARKEAKFTDEQISQLEAFVQANGGGPERPTGNLRDTTLSLGQGGDLFRLNCASCHGFSGAGAPLSAGKLAPTLKHASDSQLYTAMQTGPENMPVFNDNQLTSNEKRAIIDYIQTLKESKDPGGSGIGRIGPVSEGLVIWVAGIGGIVLIIMWIGAKA
jgi:ubiquinol-cytochrome c reductase cytochrome c subunit